MWPACILKRKSGGWTENTKIKEEKGTPLPHGCPAPAGVPYMLLKRKTISPWLAFFYASRKVSFLPASNSCFIHDPAAGGSPFRLAQSGTCRCRVGRPRQHGPSALSICGFAVCGFDSLRITRASRRNSGGLLKWREASANLPTEAGRSVLRRLNYPR